SPDGQSITTAAIDTSLANLLIIGLSLFQTAAAGVIPPKDSLNNTWTPLTVQQIGGDNYTVIYYAKNPIVGAAHTFTSQTNAGSAFATICVGAFRGASNNPFDVENGATAAPSTTVQTGSVTPSNNNELIVTALTMNTGGQTASIDSGFTILDQVDLVSGQHYGGALAYKIKTNTTAENPTWTVTSSISLTTRIAAFIAMSVVFAAGGLHQFIGEIQSTSISSVSSILDSSMGIT